MSHSEAPTSRCKKVVKYFLLHCVSAEQESQSFEIQFQTRDINIFVLCGVISVLNFQDQHNINRWHKINKLIS